MALANPTAEELTGLGEAGYRLAVRLLRSRDDAEDALQQAYLEALKGPLPQLPPEDLRKWFLKVVAHTAGKVRRSDSRRQRRELAVIRESAAAFGAAQRGVPADPTLDRELVEKLRQALEALDDEHRVPVSLCYEQLLTQRDAADVLDMPLPTLSRRVGEGLEQLRKTLARSGYAAAPAAVIGGLAYTAPAMPAGLAAAVQGIVAGATGAIGKAAASTALKISSRLGAKKAAGLALGWKVAGLVAVTGLASIAAMGFWLKAPPPPRAATSAEPAAPALPGGPEQGVPASARRLRNENYGRVLFDDEFDGTLANWDVIVGTTGGASRVLTGDPAPYARIEKDRHHPISSLHPDAFVSVESCLVMDTQDVPNQYVKIMSKKAIEAERFVVEMRCASSSTGVGTGRSWVCDYGIDVPERDVTDDEVGNAVVEHGQGFTMRRWEFTPARERGEDVLRCLVFRYLSPDKWNDKAPIFSRSSYMKPSSKRLVFMVTGWGWRLVIDRVRVRELLEENGTPKTGRSRI